MFGNYKVPKIEFLVNNSKQVLVKVVQPVFDTNLSPMNVCWHFAMQCIGSKKDNLKNHRAVTQYASKFSLLEKKRRIRPDKESEISQQVAILAKETLLKDFNLSQSDIDALARERRTHVPSGSDELIMHAVCLKTMANSLDLGESKCMPNDSFDNLMHELRTFGPLMAAGHFGAHVYSKSAEYLGNKFGGIPVYQYPKNSAIKTNKSVPTHNVLIVGGVKNENQNLIYYIDPGQIPSSPTSTLRMYVMSEKLFRDNMYNIFSDAFIVVGTDRNYPMMTSPPFFLYSKNYAKLQQEYRQDQIEQRKEIWNQLTATAHSSHQFYNYSDICNLALVSKKYSKTYLPLIEEIENEYKKIHRYK